MTDHNHEPESYLTRKRRGGDANHKGGFYERTFAVTKIAELASSRWEEMDNCMISSQVEAYVDDLAIHEPEFVSYFQLKAGGAVKWEGDSTGTLRYDFERQKEQCVARGEEFSLNIVVASPSAYKELIDNVPASIAQVVQVVHFPAFQSTLELLGLASFWGHVKQLCTVEDASLDMLDGLTKCLLGIWDGSGQRNLTIGKVIDELGMIAGIFAKRRNPRMISDQLRAVLTRIEGFTFLEENGFLRWWYRGVDNGCVPHPIGSPEFSTMEDSILKSMPDDFLNLEPLIA